jgi:hypothetical protein
VLAGCGTLIPDRTDTRIPLADPYSPPLSKVNVHNPTAQPVYVKLLWPEDFRQLFRVEAEDTSYLTGAIGVVAMPPQVEILTLECEPIATLDGLSEGAGLVVVTDDGAELHPIREADSQWTQSGGVEGCGVTIAP